MIVTAVVCPHPPLLVPELAGDAAGELDALRAACARAVRALSRAGADALVVVGGADLKGDPTAGYPADAAGSLRPWGVDVRVGAGEPVLPLSLTIGRWLLEREGVAGGVTGFHAVSFGAAPAVCDRLGRRLAEAALRVALLVMADGSACLSEKAPGYLDPRARSYDDHVRHVLERADAEALAALDPRQAEELSFAGRAALQVLAGAVRGDHSADGTAGKGEPVPVFGEREVYYEDPYGVGYFVATWSKRAGG